MYTGEVKNLRKHEVLTFFTDEYLQHKPEFALRAVSEQSCRRAEPMKPAVLCAGCSALEDGHGVRVLAPGRQVGSGPIPIPVSHHTENHCSQKMYLKLVLSPASEKHLVSF